MEEAYTVSTELSIDPYFTLGVFVEVDGRSWAFHY